MCHLGGRGRGRGATESEVVTIEQRPPELEQLAAIVRQTRQAAIAWSLALLPAVREANRRLRRCALKFGQMQDVLRRAIRTANDSDKALKRFDEAGIWGGEAGSAFRGVISDRQSLAEKLLQVANAYNRGPYMPDEYRQHLPELTDAECRALAKTTPFSFPAIRLEFPRLPE